VGAVRPRTLTVITAGALLVALGLALTVIPTPFVSASPGPTQDVLTEVDGKPAITVTGAPSYDTTGRLDLTTVRQTRADARFDLASAFGAWLDPDRGLLPRALVYPDDVTEQDVRQQNAWLLDRSQETARAAALRHLGYDVPERIVVESVTVGGPSDGVLEPGDVVLAVDGTPVSSADEVRAAVTKHQPGEQVVLKIRRGSDDSEVTVTAGASPDDPSRAVLGIVPAPGFEFPVDIDIHLDRDIGGPSAGLVFALGIVDRMTPGPMLDGAHVAGTGTIDQDGTVGAIGGVQQKIAAARDSDAQVFLLPSANCAEATAGRPGSMPLVPVDTLDEALAAVDQVAGGELAGLPHC
jgi:PDZ domain-containing protein